MNFEPREMRDALGCFATGIAVVTTTDDAGDPIGMTVNSFNSVSLEPPLVLFSVAKSASRLTDFLSADHFCINILNAEQEKISNDFAKHGENGFDHHPPATGRTSAPLIDDALAAFEGHKYAIHEGGDHHIFIIEIDHINSRGDGEALLYFRGAYRSID